MSEVLGSMLFCGIWETFGGDVESLIEEPRWVLKTVFVWRLLVWSR